MQWTNRMTWSVLGASAVTVLTMVTVTAKPLFAEGPEGRVPDQLEPSKDVEPTERNCWDRSTWGYDTAPTGCDQEPDQGPTPSLTRPAPPAPHDGPPLFMSHDLSSNQWNRLRAGTLQVVTFYDGEFSSEPTLCIEYENPGLGTGWIDVTGIQASTHDKGQISTFEYDLGDARLTGSFEIEGVVPNGVIDGLAFGLFWRDARGFHVLRSTSPRPLSHSARVGAWPIALNDRKFEKRTPQLETSYGRRQAQMAVYGAEYLDNGAYLITIQERAVAIERRTSKPTR